ncbi:MAG: TraX protein [Clostridiales bacterium]|nr:TraX protein [Clostridiales bacterium]
MKNYRLIPEKYRFLSSSGLKVIAVITMLIDHVASVLLRENPVVLLQIADYQLTLYTLMRTIGRIAFPIFAFLLAEGFHYTSDRKKYGIRLLVFALISEIPWNLEHSGKLLYSSQNVFFTLLLGFLGLCVIEELKTAAKKTKGIALLLALLLISIVLRADYGCSGFGFILLMGLLREYPVFRAVTGSCFLSSRWQAGMAFIPIAFYNGKRGFIKGRVLKILFYVIYPLHMLILYLIKENMGGY